jgi:uncharacterized protein
MTLAPIGSAERIRGIDIARGIALLGILLVNARFFFSPLAVSIDPTVVPPGLEVTTLDAVVWSVVEALCSFKFISLFSILFGFGLAMQAERAHAAGTSRAAFGARRLGMLLALGLVHGLVVWYGDILTLYAVLGVAVLCCARLSARTVLVLALGVACVTLAATCLVAGLQFASAVVSHPYAVSVAATDPSSTARGIDAMRDSYFNVRSDIWMNAEIAAFREGPLLDAAIFRAANFAMSYIAALFGHGWHSLAMMLLGVYALRSGLFGADESASRRRRTITVVGLAVGLPAAAAAPGAFWIFGLGSPGAAALHLVLLEFGALVLPLAYASAIVEWGPRLPAFLATALERTGRMSLTVYLSESVVCTALASWWGFALFGTVADARMALIALSVWTALVVLATWWLGRFRIGPMEWLWRRAAYARNPD